MSNMRELLAAVSLAGTMAFATVAAAKPVTLELWTALSAPPGSTALNKVVDMFNAQNPDIVIHTTAFENTAYETALRTAFAGGKPPDIAEVNAGSDAFQYVQSNQLTDLTDFVKQFQPILRPGLETMYSYGGKAYGVLWGLKVGNILYYNPEMLNQQRIDPASLSTWEGFMAACQKFLNAGIAPIAFGDRDKWPGNHYFTHLLHATLSKEEYDAIGLQTLDPSVRSAVKWSDPKATRAWQLYKDLADKKYFTSGYLSDNNDTAAGLFFAGKAPFYTTGSWGVGMAEAQSADSRISLTLFPPVKDSPEPSAVVTNSLLFTVPTTSKDVEAAKKFLAFLTSEAAQKVDVEVSADLSPYNYDTSKWQMNPLLHKVNDLLVNAKASSPFLDMIEDQSCLNENVNEANVAILTGDLTPEQAGQDHQQCVDDLRRKRGWH
jgi:raffinose/stachyose/melibiose transport system substrate-binding protein